MGWGGTNDRGCPQVLGILVEQSLVLPRQPLACSGHEERERLPYSSGLGSII